MTFDERVAALAPLGFTPRRHRPERHVSGTPGGLHRIGKTLPTYRTVSRPARLSSGGRHAGVSPGRSSRARDRCIARHHGRSARTHTITMTCRDFGAIRGARVTAVGVRVHVVYDRGSTAKYYRGNKLASSTAAILSRFLLRVGMLHGFAIDIIAARG